jgi:hypothetical protein
MIRLSDYSKGFQAGRMTLVAILSFYFSSASVGASNISGTVRNGSRGQPVAGEDVILIRLNDGMEEARAKTDARGTFRLPVQYEDKPYLVRVMHQDVGYDARASAGDVVSMQVFDAAQSVQGISGSIEIVRAGNIGKQLHVSDLYEIKNESSPPLTQNGGRTFEVYLPARAKIDSVLAAGPDKIAVVIGAKAVPGEPGHFVVNFPLRPGETKFAFNYDLPYQQHATFKTRHAYSLQQLAVMIPSSMRFTSRSAAFEVLATSNSRYQVQVVNQLAAGEGPAFDISGEGALPALGDQAHSLTREPSPTSNPPTSTAPSHVSVAALRNLDSGLKQIQPRSQTMVIGGLTATLIVACAFLCWRGRKPRSVSRIRQ